MATGQDISSVKAVVARDVVGEIVEGLLERVVRDKGGRMPVDKAVNGES